MNRFNRPLFRELSRTYFRNFSTARPTATKPKSTPSSPTVSPSISRDFPWRTIAQDPKTNEVIQERTIYARPLNFRPKLLWVVMLAMVPGCFLAADTVQMKLELDEKIAAIEQEQATKMSTLPSPENSTTAVKPSPTTPALPTETEVVATSPAVAPSPFAPITDIISPESILSGFLVSIGGAISVLILYYPTRVVSRLTQMRRVATADLPASVASKASSLPLPIRTRVDVNRKKGEELGQTWIRMETAAEGMWAGKFGLPRDIRMERVHPGLIRGGTTSSPYLRLRIDPLPTFFSLDKQSYRLDFRRVEDRDFKSKEDEVVVSWKRLEQVFGELV
ncbi:hypothetical protein HD553DRAFT_208480 [Filobasidium floriforme]|uniref:uncharacterized protein n=1 Tax=Filobasidium floriforme TaxID=5210 RepID=UPI001E8E1643|nr:uncharacterized protein HD553DRAFT_208480 [Filobasidium floriforme]KAH8086990.1 hypothetical protein HD553DRAFT_208480 [Filobasidium floriforme]